MIQMYSILTTKYMHLSFQIKFYQTHSASRKRDVFVLEALLVDNLRSLRKSTNNIQDSNTAQ